MRLLPTLNILARVALLFSLTLLAPIGMAWLGQDAGFLPLVEGLVISVVSCLLMLLLTHPFRRELHVRDGFLLVVGIWLLLPLSAAAPLMLYDPHMGFTYGYFEGMAGLTTTGSTAITNLDALPPSLNLWRHMLSWLGGMGVIVLAVAVLPMLGVGGMQMFKAEMPGPIKDAKLKPRIRETARNLWLVYSGLTIVCMLLLKLAGMTWFDAVCHAMTTVSLGGISTHNDSVAYFDSPAIEAVMVVFMIAGATNFATHYVALSRRSLMAYWRDSEFKAMLGALCAAVAGLAAYLYVQNIYPDYETALRHVTFNLISVATNTGYATADFGAWPLFVPLLMLFMSCFTACAGSTGGGIKMFRALVLLKEAGRQFTTLLHPLAVKPVRIHGRSVPPAMIFAVLGFISLYVISMVVLTFVLLLTGLDFLSAFSAVVACLNNTGPGLGIIGPSANFSIFGPGQVWVCTFAMLLGRLEIFSVLILFTPAFWRN
ncbi:TrkH family potassium uptake protein [Silvimonas iriomotensis]|uniref:Trk system potassium uptake protein n=1 Tax=Silvimonas iriomotensis TaxID=449662 RepID=A0ABQ2PAS6_9NEIS|nr:potassium transporter TrkG [Silvimonas iriomotensis]GGP22226.1 Trk system potassium uptake protein [Silvimonas iriomotensis]